MFFKSTVVTASFLLLLTQLSSASEAEWKTVWYNTGHNAEVQGCKKAVSQFTFKYGTGKRAVYSAMCNYPPAIGSALLCLGEMFDEDELKSVYKRYATSCSYYTNDTLSYDYLSEQYKNATENQISMIDISNVSLPIYQPVTPNITQAEYIAQAYIPFYENFDHGVYFGYGLMGYFCIVMLLSAFTRLLKSTGLLQKMSGPLCNYFRSYITIPAAYPKGRHAQAWGGWKVFTGLFPDRMDSLICLGFIVLHIVFWAYPYHTSEDHNVVWTSQTREFRRVLSDRTGLMAFGEVPLLILFAGRNNFLAFITGFNFSSFIHFHKCVSRMMIIDAIIHSVGYTILEKGYYLESLKELYFACGVAATTLAAALWLFSFHPLRSRGYEIFLYTHILMAAGFVAMCWYHCRELGFCEPIIASMVVWVFDRVVRIIRMTLFGFPKATITLIDGESFKVSIPKPYAFHSGQGQFGFIYFADSLLWFQNHPFTILNEGDRLSLFIKAKRGITKRIHNQLVAKGGEMTRRVCIEGPYGETVPTEKYDNALLITGGAGIPGIFGQALKLSQLEKPRNVKLILVQKTMSELQYYYEELLVKLKDTRIIIDVYLTRESSLEGLCLTSSTSSEDESFKKESSKELLPSFLNFKIGRPNMDLVLKSEIESFGGGTVAIDACGPPMMMDQLKHSVSTAVLEYGKRIDYFDEFQTW